MLYNYYNNGYHLSQWDLFWIAFKPVLPTIVILIVVFVGSFYFMRWYIRKVQQREAEEEARMKATLSPEDFNQWLLRREIRRAANMISFAHYFTNNKKGN